MSERVAAVHFTPAFGDVEANRAALVALAEEAAGAGARVVVLPELATTGFCLSRDQAEAWAEPADGLTRQALAGIARAHEAVIVCGLALREGASLFNAALVIDTDGELTGVYRKHHLFEFDHDWAAAGPEPGAVVETRAGRVGVLICHDLVYPHTLVAVASARPRLVAFPTAWLGDGSTVPTSWLFAARLIDPAPLVAANRGGQEGEEGEVRFEDPSAVLSHSGGGSVGRRGEGPEIVWGELLR